MPEFTQREIRGNPSSSRSSALKTRYLDAPLMVDIEYIRLLTESNRRTDGMETQERRAEDHASALESLSPVIHPLDRIAGNKTRFIRGAIPYANYAAGPFLKELSRQEQDAQQKHIDQGSGGGIAAALREAGTGDYSVFSGKFLIRGPELSELRGICDYWKDRCFMASGERLWRSHFDRAAFIDNGWTIGLYTAPHEPCPEGRIALDFETAIARGYLDIIRELDERLASFRPASPTDGGKLHFWRAAKRSLQGGLAFAQNYAAEALRLSSAESDPGRKAELLELAEICARVPALPPRTFREAVQSFWFTYLLGHMEGAHLGYSPGRLDSILQPWFDADPDTAGGIAVELFEELFVKMTQIEYIASLSWQGLGHGNLYQNLILGGLGANGKPAVGEVSMAILQAQINMQMTQPTLSVWYDESLPQGFLDKAAECVKTGVGYPAFFNQKVYVEHEARATGLPPDVLNTYSAMGGCTEPTLQGMSYGVVQAGFVNHGKLLDLVFNGGVDPVTGIRMFPDRPLETFADALTTFKDSMHETVRNWQRYWNYSMVAHRDTVPLIFCSVFVRDCLGRGQCMDDGGALVNGTPTTLSSGLVNVANSLRAFKTLCFDEKICRVDELLRALRDNWSGHELLRRRALEAPKWGNDDPRADDIFLDLFDDYCEFVGGQDNYLGKPYDPSMLAISTPVPVLCQAKFLEKITWTSRKTPREIPGFRHRVIHSVSVSHGMGNDLLIQHQSRVVRAKQHCLLTLLAVHPFRLCMV